MNFTALEQRRLLERPRELALHRRDLPEAAEADEDGGERGGREDEHMILASAARFKENGGDSLYHADGEALPAQMLDREPQRTLKRRLDGAAPQLDRFERGSERADRSAAPPSDPRRRVIAGGFERANDRPERGSAMDPRRLESSSTLTFDRPLARSFSAAGRERDDERERTQAADENPVLEQHKEKELSADAIQEIVAQYKSALAELTVNSKIIITKLTIFAGDNIHAAKGIAATICAHILEAPSDQKLPSLYLLDSIVKNIGRDYVELFAARLPEVFCEAHRQVDPSLHPKMKRLFETWREVFFGDPLLVIEAQLQFGSGSSNQLPATKPAPQSPPPQRPGHGIHVNPSYLEAQRQRLQQSSRPPTAETPKDGFNAEIGVKKGYVDNFLDYDYVCTDIGAKVGNEIPRTQEAWGKTWPKEDGSLLRPTESELDQPRYPKGSVLDGRHPPSRLLIDAYGNIRVPPVLKSPPVMVPPQRDRIKGGGSMQKNWEEEGHSWEEKNARPVDNDRQWEVSRKDAWFLGEGGKDSPDVGAVDKGDGRNNPAIHDRAAWHQDAPLSMPDRTNPTFQREQDESGIGAVSSSEREISAFGLNPGSIQGHQFPADRLHHTSPQHASPMMQLNLRPFTYMQPNQLPPLQLPPLPGSLSSSALPGNGSSFGFTPMLPRPIINPQSLLPPQVSASLPSPPSMSVFPSNTLGHGNSSATNQAQLSEQHVSMHPSLPHPGVQLPLPQPSPSFQVSDTQSLQAGNPLLDQQPCLFERSSGALPVLPTELLQSLKQLQEHLPGLKSMPDNQGLVAQSEQIGVSQQQQQQQQQQWNQQVLPPVADHRHLGQIPKADGAQTGTQNHNPGHLLAAFFGNAAVSSSESAQQVPEKSFATPFFRDPAQFSIPSMYSGQPQSLFPAAQSSFPPVAVSAHASHPGQVLHPPLPPGPPPLSSQVASLPAQPLTNITSLLSSLVAQGVISAANSATSLPQSHIGPTSPLLASKQHMDASHVAVQVPSDDDSSTAMASTFSAQGFTSIFTDAPSVGGPLGVEFKTELLRERHDFVVNVLYSNLVHQCKTCGLRCKSQDDLMKHMERHAPKNNMQNLVPKLSRNWFANKEEWVKGVDSSVSHLPAIPEYMVNQSSPKVEDNEEPAVPADEDQAACTLCGEPFEDFYDDETDLWMYKGAVYLNTVPGMASKDKGPIVHAKCRSTSDVPDMDIMEAEHELEQANKRLRYQG